MRNTIAYPLLAAAALLSAPPVGAQVPVRSVGSIDRAVSRAGGQVWRFRMESKSAELSWDLLHLSGPHDLSVSLAFDRPGGFLPLGGDRFLVTGFDSSRQCGKVVLIDVHESPRSIVVLEELTLPSVDPYSIVYRADESRLYLHDCRNGEVLVAPFFGAALPTVGSFASIAVPQALNQRRGLVSREAEPGVALYMNRALFGFVPGPVLIHQDQQGLWLVEEEGEVVPQTTLPERDVGPFPNAIGSLVIGGASGQFGLYRRSDDQLVWSGVLPDADWHSVEVPPGLVTPGDSYYVGGSTGQVLDSGPVVINSRWGRLPPGTGTRIEFLPDETWRPTPGDADYFVSGRLHWSVSEQPAEVLPVWLWYGVKGEDPVAYGPNGQAVMNEPTVVGPQFVQVGPGTTLTSAADLVGVFSFELPTPSTMPAGGDAELIFQFATIDSTANEIVTSDVFGTRVFSASMWNPSTIGAASLAAPSSPVAEHSECPAGYAVWAQARGSCLSTTDN